jgi:hypothetical protein
LSDSVVPAGRSAPGASVSGAAPPSSDPAAAAVVAAGVSEFPPLPQPVRAVAVMAAANIRDASLLTFFFIKFTPFVSFLKVLNNYFYYNMFYISFQYVNIVKLCRYFLCIMHKLFLVHWFYIGFLFGNFVLFPVSRQLASF